MKDQFLLHRLAWQSNAFVLKIAFRFGFLPSRIVLYDDIITSFLIVNFQLSPTIPPPFRSLLVGKKVLVIFSFAQTFL